MPVTSWLAALLKPIWLSLICTKLKPAPARCVPPAAPAGGGEKLEVGTPPAIVHSRPVPAQAMQLRKLRRSMPSLRRVSCAARSRLIEPVAARVYRYAYPSWVNPPRMQTGQRAVYSGEWNNCANCQFSSVERRRDRSDRMTLLPWKRAARETGPQTARLRTWRCRCFPRSTTWPSGSPATPRTRRTWCRRHF